MEHNLLVCFGSETGTTEEMAIYVAGLARRRRFLAEAKPLSDLDPATLAHEGAPVLLLVSTTGDGEVPETMRGFWRRLLRRGLPPTALSGLRFALFGAGDRTYGDKFNAAARKLHVRLLQLGASEFSPRGLGDYQSPNGLWGDLDAWLVPVWAALLAQYPLPPGFLIDDDGAMTEMPPPLLEAEVLPPPPLPPPPPTNGSSTAVSASAPAATPAAAAAAVGAAVNGAAYKDACTAGAEGPAADAEDSDALADFYAALRPAAAYAVDGCRLPYFAKVLVNRRLTAAGHSQDVRHIELDVSNMGPAQQLQAGDVATVHPENDPVAVAAFAELLRLPLDSVIRIRLAAAAGAAGAAAGTLLPRQCSLKVLLGRCLDICGTPRRLFFERLAPFAADVDEAAKLRELASPAGAELLQDYACRERRSYLEVLRDFPSCRPPLPRFLEILPRLRPRHFSVASSPLAHPGRVHLCVAVVAHKTPRRRSVAGVCSSWLARMAPGDAVPLLLRPGLLAPPASPQSPLLMVGPGTGVAPMRAIVQHRQHRRAMAAAAAAAPVCASSALRPGAFTANGVGAAVREGASRNGARSEIGTVEPDKASATLNGGAAGQLPNGAAASAGGGGATSGSADAEAAAAKSAAVFPAAAAPWEDPGAGLALDTLYFGCRHRAGDFLYADEWRESAARGLRFFAAFSRDQPDGSKVYVQHLIAECGPEIARLLRWPDAAVLVSGAAQQMPADVRAALRKVLVEHGGLAGEKEAERWLMGMEKGGRYRVEAWS